VGKGQCTGRAAAAQGASGVVVHGPAAARDQEICCGEEVHRRGDARIWWLKGDETATGKGLLVGPECPYCSDNTWEVMSAAVP
jgi:hypothetical protein